MKYPIAIAAGIAGSFFVAQAAEAALKTKWAVACSSSPTPATPLR
jgi:hypothetical protein